MSTTFEEAEVITKNIVKTIKRLYGTSEKFRTNCAVAVGSRSFYDINSVQSEGRIYFFPGVQRDATGSDTPGVIEQRRIESD